MLLALVVPDSIRSDLLTHAERESPREAVGILGGRGSTAMRVLPLLNRAVDQHAFFADPHQQYLAERSLEREGLEVVALYHSHPGGGAAPSIADLEFSVGWPCAQLIVVPAGGPNASARIHAYRWLDGELHEVSVLAG